MGIEQENSSFCKHVKPILSMISIIIKATNQNFTNFLGLI